MANVKLVFGGAKEYLFNGITIELFKNTNGGLYISIIDTKDYDERTNQQCIVLDKETAIRLSKELRKQIALMS